MAGPAGLVLISPALPAALRPPAKPHQLRDVPEIYRRDQVGWGGLPEVIRRRNPDLSVADVLRIQHMMGAESGLARRDVVAGVSVDRGRAAEDRAHAWSSGVVSIATSPEPDSERLAEWLGAEYQPYRRPLPLRAGHRRRRRTSRSRRPCEGSWTPIASRVGEAGPLPGRLASRGTAGGAVLHSAAAGRSRPCVPAAFV